jgi:hypothetical protein
MNQFITLEEAQQMTAHYRKENEIMLQPEYRDRGILPITEIFQKKVVETLLSRPGVTGLRIYYGMTPDSRVHSILVGVTADGKPVLPESGSEISENAEDGYLAERAIRCPYECDIYADLNT